MAPNGVEFGYTQIQTPSRITRSDVTPKNGKWQNKQWNHFWKHLDPLCQVEKWPFVNFILAMTYCCKYLSMALFYKVGGTFYDSRCMKPTASDSHFMTFGHLEKVSEFNEVARAAVTILSTSIRPRSHSTAQHFNDTKTWPICIHISSICTFLVVLQINKRSFANLNWEQIEWKLQEQWELVWNWI